MEVSERSFEKTIECGLLRYGPDACAGEGGAVREAAPPNISKLAFLNEQGTSKLENGASIAGSNGK